jgi:hypothetical protein
MKLTSIAKGEYESSDGRFKVRDAYDPSGAAHVREGKKSSLRWHAVDTQSGRSYFRSTLAEIREKIQEISDRESTKP